MGASPDMLGSPKTAVKIPFVPYHNRIPPVSGVIQGAIFP